MGENRDIESESAFERSQPDPVKLSFAGGAVGTITGLKRGGVPGAFLGGLVGGTAGYFVAATSSDVTRPPGSHTTDTDPVQVDVSGTSTETSDESGEADAEHEDDGHEDDGTDEGT